MKLCLLRSGSSGNCTLVKQNTTTILLDAGGLSQVGFRNALEEVAVAVSALDAAVVSHTHSDHLNQAALSLFRKYGIPLWVHYENMAVIQDMLKKYHCKGVAVHCFSNEAFSVKDITLLPFPVNHDARETTSGFKMWATDDPDKCVSYATDLGCFPDNLLDYFVDSTGIVLEANHDIDLLWNNPFRPFFHKKRVASDVGHLSNAQAAEALVKICRASRLHPLHIVLSHLSKDHNSPEMALEHIGRELEKCGFRGNLTNAFREKKTAFIEV
jgi:Metal-dependent hydrolases of the beta-lactamase superfamily I